MELTFSEIDNHEININPTKYWETQQPIQSIVKKQESIVKKQEPIKQEVSIEQKSKKKKVSFDDILSNMNLVVNQKGSLQFITPTQEYLQPSQEQQNHQYQQQGKQEQIAPVVKHSYIYNKYFKDYQDASPSAPEIRVPKTKEEYYQMLIDDKLKQIEERKRISQIKSTKMLFTSNVNGLNINPSLTNNNIQSSKNGLRMMNFR